jgi:hypothetical protein
MKKLRAATSATARHLFVPITLRAPMTFGATRHVLGTVAPTVLSSVVPPIPRSNGASPGRSSPSPPVTSMRRASTGTQGGPGGVPIRLIRWVVVMGQNRTSIGVSLFNRRRT